MKLNPEIHGKPVVVVQYNPFGDLRTLPPEPAERRIMPPANKGSIIAVSYPARAFGVKRNMNAVEARKLCPELIAVQVPVAHGKADLTIYRDAGAQVLDVLASQSIAERASIDECYLDVTAAATALLRREAAAASAAPPAPAPLTDEAAAAGGGGGAADAPAAAARAPPPPPGSFEGWHVAGAAEGGTECGAEGGAAGAAAGAAGWWARRPGGWSSEERLLAAGGRVVAGLREAVERRLGFTCSAGIAHSKVLAKLASGLHKPRQQTLVPSASVRGLLDPLPIGKLRQLGGKFGDALAQRLAGGAAGPDGGRPPATVGDLVAVPLPRLVGWVGEEAGAWLYRLARGVDDGEVKPRTLPKSVSCGKTFRGASALRDAAGLARELEERISADRRAHQRLPQLLTVSFDGAGAAGGGGSGQGNGGGGGGPSNSAGASGGGGGGASAVSSGPPSPAASPQKTPPAPAAAPVGGGWRAEGQTVSRSTQMGRPQAAAIADAAAGLVRRWAAEQAVGGGGWRIYTLFLTASGFQAAPTGASTLQRFLVPRKDAPVADAAAGGGATPGGEEGAGDGGGAPKRPRAAPGGGAPGGGARKRARGGGGGGGAAGGGQASISRFVAPRSLDAPAGLRPEPADERAQQQLYQQPPQQQEEQQPPPQQQQQPQECDFDWEEDEDATWSDGGDGDRGSDGGVDGAGQQQAQAQARGQPPPPPPAAALTLAQVDPSVLAELPYHIQLEISPDSS
ncbi:MAG: hypothetical protein J3K34DRAFT_525446 [Monoraphidium minutum]|nr:MAG: hypothetical protein J3K34DRAFT_525446 [Monoraphidium minutum]